MSYSPLLRQLKSRRLHWISTQQVLLRRQVVQGFMGPLGVVHLEPAMGHPAHLIERVEHVEVEQLMTVGAVETLDVSVLSRLPRLDVGEFHSVRLGPSDKGRRQVL